MSNVDQNVPNQLENDYKIFIEKKTTNWQKEQNLSWGVRSKYYGNEP